ncbi:MAG: tRNA (N6-threonylcarbamoyladenosine(37)-N6)-methyltransferase TrmO [Candidatus Cloacimonetes bacterium 4572_55]|nr:MAG: tRNA (N6-threonylcarbamoyladenosine(37)-N6)-methyltransferase TrmO [Candidatus Cloacimonetes bacterium 4572_55]
MNPIGVIRSPWKTIEDMPIQAIGGEGVVGYIELYPKFIDGLKGLDGFSHIFLLYLFHRNKDYNLLTKPFLSDNLKGVFATRAPKRPNPIGLSTVEIISIEDNIINVRNIDILDETPLLDIKPYVQAFDSFTHVKNGWLEDAMHRAITYKSDKSFS